MRQAAEDWNVFLYFRARELRPGGRLVIVMPGADDDRITGFEDIFIARIARFPNSSEQRVISTAERARMALAVAQNAAGTADAI